MSKSRTLHAVLIGVDAYKQSPLNGCIQDVLSIDRLFREQCSQQADVLTYNPLYLLAPNDRDRERITAYSETLDVQIAHELPTFTNVSQKAFAHLKKANDGDICVFYYSGHGSQVDAPEVFWHLKPDRQNETIVCVDSRDADQPEARDLIDKELAFLLWDALKDKNVHALVMMDSCHSAENTKNIIDGTDNTTYRSMTSSKNKIPFEKYIGFENDDFYGVTGENARIKVARYVHMAAARSFEKAQETAEGGLFTTKLVEVLRAGGTAKSYRDLARSLAVTVRNRNLNQNPVAFAREDADLDQQFLGNGIVPYQPTFEVRYNRQKNQWIMTGGALHGITPSAGDEKTTVRIIGNDVNQEVSVVRVLGDSSVLNEAEMSGFDKDSSFYTAVVASLANAAVPIGFAPNLIGQPEQMELISNQLKKSALPYFTISTGPAETDYLIGLTADNQFKLTGANSDIPLFKRDGEPASFLGSVNSFAKWLNTLEVRNQVTTFRKEDFVFNVEKIEGKVLESVDREAVTGQKWTLTPDGEVVFSYVGDIHPAFRLSISIAENSSLQSCFVGALYLDSKFGIVTDLISSDSSQLVKNGSPLSLQLMIGDRPTPTINLERDPKYDQFQINEIMDYLKIFVSDRVLDLSNYQQDSLELDEAVPKAVGKGLSTGKPRSMEWAVFDFKFRIVGPQKEQALKPGGITDFGPFTIEAPEGFHANAFAATGDDIIRKQITGGMRGIDEDMDLLVNNILPRETAWGDAITGPAFPTDLATGSDNLVEVIELRMSGDNQLELKEGESLIIRPKIARDVTGGDDFEDVVIPCGFDEASHLLYPIGFSDESGAIHINFLPEGTDGLIQGDEALSRSIGKSVKMFFRRLFKKKTGVNVLVLYELKADGSWHKETEDISKINKALRDKPNAKVLLLTHGLTGDTRHMVAALEELPDLQKTVSYVLTYDYENLATPIEDAAAVLHKSLTKAGFGEAGMPKLTIIAHSQGGLLARWLVEQEGGSAYVNHLILVAAASSGSELAKLGTVVFGLLTHALNVTGPIKLVVTGLSFLLKALKSDPDRTLKDTSPQSDFVAKLGKSGKVANVRYNVIVGDTNLIEREFDGDDTFLQKLKKALAGKLVIPALNLGLFNGKLNDIAVTIESATFIAGYDAANTRIVASNHLAYFRKELAQKELMEFLQQDNV